MKNIFVTGGAGYIGSHISKELLDKHYSVLVYDNLQKGHRKAVDSRAVFIGGDLSDAKRLDKVFKEHKIDAVIHLAADSLVEESVKNPEKYWKNNVENGKILLDVMAKNKVRKIVFSSSAAVYGEPEKIPIREEDKLKPINPYGKTKLEFEKILQKKEKTHNISFISLRYFNAAGADPSGKIGEDHKPETHLIPIVLQVALGKRDHVNIYGTDYNTKDGTCIRDYIHVTDLAIAHIAALKSLDKGSSIYNLGSEKGYSVEEVIETARKVTGKPIRAIAAARRSNDPPILIASSKKIKKELKWKPKYGELAVIIKTAWKWHKNHPNGFEE
ncbi:UDP-glucose 4-epimerase GalE [Candidatus Woesearchaeota archaeon]|nr:UDP-glucose 4-epimerase GalE [Candidatus Woesearchaeota archaeon]